MSGMETTSEAAPTSRAGSMLPTLLIGLAFLAVAIVFAASSSWYATFMTVHVLFVVVWIGGGALLTIFGVLAERTNDAAQLSQIARMAAFAGERIFAPAAIVVVAMGIAMVLNADLGFGHFWIIFGLLGFLATFVIGIGVLSPMAKKVDALLREKGPNDPETQAAIARILVIARADVAMLGEDINDFGAETATDRGSDTDPMDQSMLVGSTDILPREDNFLRKSVFFGNDSADLTSDAKDTIKRFATRFNGAAPGTKGSRPADVTLEAHTSKSGTDEYNMGLAQKRADAVRGELTTQGSRSITTRVKDDIEGKAGATGDAAHDRRVDLIADGGAAQVVIAHEFGHAFGLPRVHDQGRSRGNDGRPRRRREGDAEGQRSAGDRRDPRGQREHHVRRHPRAPPALRDLPPRPGGDHLDLRMGAGPEDHKAHAERHERRRSAAGRPLRCCSSTAACRRAATPPDGASRTTGGSRSCPGTNGASSSGSTGPASRRCEPRSVRPSPRSTATATASPAGSTAARSSPGT
jgi:outer membrane protein OmpA-like peptidoglycan-associated protein